jgi:DNA-binding NarL/FixJ family response regulator
MSLRIPVSVYASDPISPAGVVAQLRSRAAVEVVEKDGGGPAAVAVVVAEEVDGTTLQIMKALRRNGCGRVVLVLNNVDDAGLLAATSAAAGEGAVPPDLLGRLLGHVGRLHEQVLAPRGLTLNGLTEREVDVLKLLAEGLSTSEIAHRLSYSERTIKNVIHDVTSRFHLRNRSHAVAYAMRAGLI